jgi:hypothetical protein
MPLRKALHNAVRRYCMEVIQAFIALHNELYSQGRLQEPNPHFRQLEIRFSVLHNLLVEIERTTPSDFATVAALRDHLLAMTEAIQSERRSYSWSAEREVRTVTREPFNAEQEAVRGEFLGFVRGLSEDDLRQVPPLPFRRVLSDSQARRIAKGVSQRWGFEATKRYWWPLREGYPEQMPVDVLVLQERHFYTDLGVDAMRGILLTRGITRLFELTEHHFAPEYEIDIELCTFRGNETIWTSRSLDWLIYVSHESSITFAGEWLVAAVKQAWPMWERRIYIDYIYE